jgi:hypothetical protein
MSAMDGLTVDVGQLPVTGVLVRALRLYGENFVALWTVLVPIAATAQLIGLIGTIVTAPAGSESLNGTVYIPVGEPHTGFILAGVLTFIVTTLASILAGGATVWLLAEGAAGRAGSPSAALSFARDRFGALLWLSFLLAAVIGIGFFLLVLPGFYLLIVFSVALPVLVVEDRRGGVALERSRELVRGRWWATFAVIISIWVVVVAGYFVIGELVQPTGSVALYEVLRACMTVVAQVLLEPLFVAASVAVYLDLRARKEPGTLGSLTLVGEPPPSSPPPPAAGGWYR